MPSSIACWLLCVALHVALFVALQAADPALTAPLMVALLAEFTASPKVSLQEAMRLASPSITSLPPVLRPTATGSDIRASDGGRRRRPICQLLALTERRFHIGEFIRGRPPAHSTRDPAVTYNVHPYPAWTRARQNRPRESRNSMQQSPRKLQDVPTTTATPCMHRTET